MGHFAVQGHSRSPILVPISTFRIVLCVFVIGDRKDYKFDVGLYRLNVQVTAHGRQTVPDWGVVRSWDPLQNFGAPIISLHVMERLNLKSSNFVHVRVGNINSMQQDDISPTKGRGFGHVTVLKFCR